MHTSDLQTRMDRERNAIEPGTGHPVPGTLRWDAQFRRGWAVGFVIAGTGFIGGLVTATWTVSIDSRVRALAVSVASIAGLFLFAMVYMSSKRIGFGLQDGVVWPDERPVLYWSLIGMTTTLSVAIITAAAWAFLHAHAAAEMFSASQ